MKKRHSSRASSLGQVINLLDLFDIGMKVNVWDERKKAWISGCIVQLGSNNNKNDKSRKSSKDSETQQQQDQIVVVESFKNKFVKIKIDLLEHPEYIEEWDPDDVHEENKGLVKVVKNRSDIKPPTDMVTFMSQQSRRKILKDRPLPTLPKFGSALSKQKCTKVNQYDAPIPDILAYVCRLSCLFCFCLYKFVAIFFCVCFVFKLHNFSF